MHEYPEITFRRDALSCSINDRLGALLELFTPTDHPARAAGAWIAPLTRNYLGELVEFAVANCKDMETDLEDALSRNREGR